jgi:predicted amidohydrolase
MTHEVNVGLAQISAEPYEIDANRALCEKAINAAFGQGADLVILPELIVSGYVADGRRLFPLAEPVPGPSTAAWEEMARRASGYIVAGLCEREGESLYNSAVLVGPEGLIGHYRKAHLFADEKVAFVPGNLGFPVVRTRFGTIGICVCYDLRFVEVVRLMALRGANMICVPTAWLPGFDQDRRDAAGMSPQGHVARLQANLNQVFIAAASQAGRHGGNDFLGSSILVDPYGHVVLGPMSGDQDQIEVVTIDMAAAERSQQRGDLIAPRADRRTDLYGIVSGQQVL